MISGHAEDSQSSLISAEDEWLIDADHEAANTWRQWADIRCECEHYWGTRDDCYRHTFGQCTCWCEECERKRTSVAFKLQLAEEARQREEERERQFTDLKAAAERRQAERKAWEASDDGKAELARWAEEARLAEEKEQKERAWRLKVGPMCGPKVAEDPVVTVRRMVAWASPGDQPTHYYGNLYVQRSRGREVLVEMRSNESCTDESHIRARAENKANDWDHLEECDADCDSSFTLVPIKNAAGLKAYLKRRKIVPAEWVEWAGHWWKTEVEDEAFDAAWADGFWPGCSRLTGVSAVPFLREDNSVVDMPGFDPASGVWGVEVHTSRTALPVSLADQILEVAQSGPWVGTMTQLAELLAWTGTAKALSAQIKKLMPRLAALGVRIERVGKVGPTRADGLRISAIYNAPTLSTRPTALPPGDLWRSVWER
jgi:hypothetical protein